MFKARILLPLLFALALFPPAMAQNIGGLERLDRIDTGYFSIYYPLSLEDQAKRLSSFADSVLADLTALIGSPTPKKRLPILLSDIAIDLNGYFTSYPSNRIVLYLSGARPSSSLASLGDELKSVFLHELVHALSLNLRGPFWSVLSALSGDALAPANWVAPASLVEGTAVWAESRESPQGRLNDPAALESVYLDLEAGKMRDLWTISGLADFPGAGSFPYYYGALFVTFVEEGYGTQAVRRLWSEVSRGEPFTGFDGSLFGGGALERALGKPASALWVEFQSWLSARAKKEASDSTPKGIPETIDLDTKRIGAFTAGNSFVYYYDGERKAVCSFNLGNKSQKWLFAADARLEAMRISGDGKTLLLDWARESPDSKVQGLSYGYDIASGKLISLGPRPVKMTGAALANLESGKPIELEAAQVPDASGWMYGLARMGSLVLPARTRGSDEVELLDAADLVFRSISLDKNPIDLGQSPSLLVLSAVAAGGVSKLALLESSGENWTLRVQKSFLPGGARDPFISGGEVFYRSSMDEGRSEIRKLHLDEGVIDNDFRVLSGTWIPLDTYRKTLPTPVEKAFPRSASGILFPKALASTRYPWIDSEAVGLKAIGMDLTNRLSWTAFAGWDYVNSAPEAAVTLGLDSGNQAFFLSLTDRAAASASTSRTIRRSTAMLSHDARFGFVPAHYRINLDEAIWCSGMDDDYSLAEFASPSYSYVSTGGRLSLAWSTINSQAFPPWDIQGFSARGGADYEAILNRSQGWSIFGSAFVATARPSLSLGIYGALSPDYSLAFLPAGRLITSFSGIIGSALLPPYPIFKEYANTFALSPWYLSAEATATLLDLELWGKMGPLRLPFLPSLGLRRIVFRGGLRAAAFESETVAFPASAFLRMESDAALLAGMIAEAHLSIMAEASYAFTTSLPGGGTIHFDYGLGLSY